MELGLVSTLDPAVLWPLNSTRALVLPGSYVHLWGWRGGQFKLKHMVQE